MVVQTCRERKVAGYEPLVSVATAWLNSPPVAWLYIYLLETVQRSLFGPSLRLADSGNLVFQSQHEEQRGHVSR